MQNDTKRVRDNIIDAAIEAQIKGDSPSINWLFSTVDGRSQARIERELEEDGILQDGEKINFDRVRELIGQPKQPSLLSYCDARLALRWHNDNESPPSLMAGYSGSHTTSAVRQLRNNPPKVEFRGLTRREQLYALDHADEYRWLKGSAEFRPGDWSSYQKANDCAVGVYITTESLEAKHAELLRQLQIQHITRHNPGWAIASYVLSLEDSEVERLYRLADHTKGAGHILGEGISERDGRGPFGSDPSRWRQDLAKATAGIRQKIRELESELRFAESIRDEVDAYGWDRLVEQLTAAAARSVDQQDS